MKRSQENSCIEAPLSFQVLDHPSLAPASAEAAQGLNEVWACPEGAKPKQAQHRTVVASQVSITDSASDLLEQEESGRLELSWRP